MYRVWCVLLLLFAAACSGRSRTTQAPPVAAQQDAADATPAIDARAGDAAVGIDFTRTWTVVALATSIGRSFTGVSDADWQVTVGVRDKDERASWLAKDFSAPAFRKVSQFDEALLQVSSPQGPLHVAVWLMHFADCKALTAARDRVLKTQRLNLTTAALTVFRMHTQERTLFFLLSETPMHPEVQDVLKAVDAQAAFDTDCLQ